MAKEYSKILVSPDGKEFEARSPREAIDLIFGSGYKEKGAKEAKSNSDTAAKAKAAPKTGEGSA